MDIAQLAQRISFNTAAAALSYHAACMEATAKINAQRTPEQHIPNVANSRLPSSLLRLWKVALWPGTCWEGLGTWEVERVSCGLSM